MLENEMLDKLLENVLESIKRGGEKITSEILVEKLEKYELSEDQTDYITEKLEEMGVQFADDTSEAERDDFYDEIVKEIPTGDHVKLYLKDIGKFPLLSMEEEIELAKRMSEGDEDATLRERARAAAENRPFGKQGKRLPPDPDPV